MPKIKHIALSTQDVDATAKFYIDVFGMKEIAKVDSPGASGYYLSDGDLNLAILKFKSDAVAGVERGKEWSGIHHIGFEVESLEDITAKLAAAGSKPRDDVNQALGVGPRPPRGRQRRGEVHGPRRHHGRRLRDRLGRHQREHVTRLSVLPWPAASGTRDAAGLAPSSAGCRSTSWP